LAALVFCSNPPGSYRPSPGRSAIKETLNKENPMKQPSVYLKMRVLGAVDTALGRTRHERIHNVAAMTFLDEEGNARRFTWRTIVHYIALIAFWGEYFRIVVRMRDVCYTENLATGLPPLSQPSRSLPRTPLKEFYRTPPLPRISAAPVES
jgi:hypothetical protein